MMTPEDSKRVADALIKKIETTYIEDAITDAIKSFLVPSRNKWHDDWLPLSIEHFLTNVESAIMSKIE